jgi:hypothetical protein
MEEKYEIGSSPDGTYVYARAFRHPYTAEIALTVAGDLVRFGEKLDVLGCLVDIRGSASVSSVVDKYKFAFEKAELAGLSRHWRYAFVIDHGDDSPDFIETVMKNAGYAFQVFEDEREAIDWLQKQ